MPQLHDPAGQLIRASSDLDTLIRDVGLGARSQRDIDEFEARAQAIADQVRGTFRVAVGQSIRPLKVTATGAWY